MLKRNSEQIILGYNKTVISVHSTESVTRSLGHTLQFPGRQDLASPSPARLACAPPTVTSISATGTWALLELHHHNQLTLETIHQTKKHPTAPNPKCHPTRP
jgi:hypothetical protein